MRKTIAIVFAGGRAEEMSVLTHWRPKSAVLFGGAYRMIDFALTNLANTAGIENVGILSQYRPSSLIDHVGIGLPWDFVGNERGVRFLPPTSGWTTPSGTAARPTPSTRTSTSSSCTARTTCSLSPATTRTAWTTRPCCGSTWSATPT